MKNYILALGLLLSFIAPSRAQMTLTHTFAIDRLTISEVVNLSISGKKIAVSGYDNLASRSDTIFYYNTDYSFWKEIILPSISGFNPSPWFCSNDIVQNWGISYVSETLFNTDSLLEVAVYYYNDTNSLWGKELIINENGVIIDSILNVYDAFFSVHDMGSGTFIATATTETGLNLYSLPGNLPCDICGGGLGLAKTEPKPANLLANPIPNPSKNEVKITFTLPEGADRGELTIYNTEGQKMKSYTVDNRFGFIMVDDSQFAPGMYYYNLTVNGQVSSSQKMLVI